MFGWMTHTTVAFKCIFWMETQGSVGVGVIGRDSSSFEFVVSMLDIRGWQVM